MPGMDVPARDDPPADPGYVTIRRATAADLASLVPLRLAFDHELAGELPADRAVAHEEAVRAYLESHLPDGRFLAWVAETPSGALVGMVGMVVIDRPPHPRSRRPGEGFVFNVYTVPDWRRRGVARRLMQALIDHARALRLRRLLLRTSDAGRGVYDALGFADPGYYRQLDLD
jgi:GNAT superfamily N-acetyltransferase